MALKTIKQISKAQKLELLQTLQVRFNKNKNRHYGIDWHDVQKRLESAQDKLWSLYQMEDTGGEPDVIGKDQKTGEYIFIDCASESPKGRRSLCYDRAGLESRKEFAPQDTAVDMANAMGVNLLNEEEYKSLQRFGKFDSKTSSWINTPDAIRKHGGALFGDFRYEHVFIYHNGAQSYYAARGFRASLKI
jgi:hypothetical protein